MKFTIIFCGFFLILSASSESTNDKKIHDNTKKDFNSKILDDIKHLSELKRNDARHIGSLILEDIKNNQNNYPKQIDDMRKTDINKNIDSLNRGVNKDISSGKVRQDIKVKDHDTNKKTTVKDNKKKSWKVLMETRQDETIRTKTKEKIKIDQEEPTEKDRKINKDTIREKNTDSHLGENENSSQGKITGTDLKATEDTNREESKEIDRDTDKETDQKNAEATDKEITEDTNSKESENKVRANMKETDGRLANDKDIKNNRDNEHEEKIELSRNESVNPGKGIYMEVKLSNKTNTFHSSKHNLPPGVNGNFSKTSFNNVHRIGTEENILNTNDTKVIQNLTKINSIKAENNHMENKLTTNKRTIKKKLSRIDTERKEPTNAQLNTKPEAVSKEIEEKEMKTLKDMKQIAKPSTDGNAVVEEKAKTASYKHLTKGTSGLLTTKTSPKTNLINVTSGDVNDKYETFAALSDIPNSYEQDGLTTQSTDDSVQKRIFSKTLEENLNPLTSVRKIGITKAEISVFVKTTNKRYPPAISVLSTVESSMTANTKHFGRNPSDLSFENIETAETHSKSSNSTSGNSNKMNNVGNLERMENQRTLDRLPETDFENNLAEKSASSGPCQTDIDPSIQYTGSALIAAAVGGVFIGAFAVLILFHLKQKCKNYVNGDYRRVPMEYDFELNPRFKTH